MATLQSLGTLLAALALFLGLVEAETCNPLKGACPAIPGLLTGTYLVDFTKQNETPSDWILADHATVTYGAPNGANFTFAKRKDAPYIWTRFYVLFGRIEVVLKAAPGAGIITGAVMMSDDQDEIDWEWSGNNFAQSTGQVQTNFFGKGIAGTYGRGTSPPVEAPQDQYHTYALDWTPQALTWSIDGKNVRTLNNNGLSTGEWQYPQTPARLHLGLWCSGDPDNNGGTIAWGGGATDFTKLPYSAYVQSVKITTPSPCSSWQYPSPFNGSYTAVQCTSQTISLPCTYSVVPGDDGYKIAKNLTVNFETLKAANPGLNWDALYVGQILKVPGGLCTTSTVPTSATSSSTSTTSSVLSTSVMSVSSPVPSSSTLTTTTPLASSSSSSSTLTTTASTSASSTTTLCTTSSSTSTPSSSMTRTTTTPSSNPTANVTSSSTGTGITTSSAPAAANTQYKIAPGDNWKTIAQKIGFSLDALKAANPGFDWTKITIGKTLNIPLSARSSTSTSSSVTSSVGTIVSTANSTASGSTQQPTSSTSGSGSTTQGPTASSSSGTSSAPSMTGTSSASSSSTTPAPPTTSSRPNLVQPTLAPNASTTLKCNEDNCLRNLLDPRIFIPSSMHAFCTGYIARPTTTMAIPTYLGGCSGNATRVSSACNCLVTNYSNPSGIVTKTATSGAASSKKRSVLRWERSKW